MKLTSTTSRPASSGTTGLGGASLRSGARDGRRRHGLRKLLIVLLCFALAGLGFLLGGFLKYADSVLALRPPDPLVADGIVVLTGGAERISGAVDLMMAGKAKRLLISGVHPDTSARQLGRIVDAGPSLMDCCVDLDRRAANTIGNAVETAKWAHRNGFLSLIVVTSAYHMPRSMLELGHAMPDIRLIPYPVTRPELALDRWASRPETIALLFEEYLKYTLTRARLAIAGIDGLPDFLASVSE